MYDYIYSHWKVCWGFSGCIDCSWMIPYLIGIYYPFNVFLTPTVWTRLDMIDGSNPGYREYSRNWLWMSFRVGVMFPTMIFVIWSHTHTYNGGLYLGMCHDLSKWAYGWCRVYGNWSALRHPSMSVAGKMAGKVWKLSSLILLWLEGFVWINHEDDWSAQDRQRAYNQRV